MKVAVLGPKGQCGSCIVDELLQRGHTTVGLSRSPPATWKLQNEDENAKLYSAVAIDLHDTEAFANVLSDGFDAIICAYGPPMDDFNTLYLHCVEAHAKIKAAVLASKHEGSIIIIGGAGSLHMKHGGQFVDEPGFAFKQWYQWPDRHLRYMQVRAADHGSSAFYWFIRSLRWAIGNVERPGWFSWLARPFARLILSKANNFLTSHQGLSLIRGSRIALSMWEGVTAKKWSFLSPPWLLRDKGVRTGEYKAFEDSKETPGWQAVEKGIYNEDMAVAIVDEVENNAFVMKHWTCTGPIDLKEW